MQEKNNFSKKMKVFKEALRDANINELSYDTYINILSFTPYNGKKKVDVSKETLDELHLDIFDVVYYLGRYLLVIGINERQELLLHNEIDHSPKFLPIHLLKFKKVENDYDYYNKYLFKYLKDSNPTLSSYVRLKYEQYFLSSYLTSDYKNALFYYRQALNWDDETNSNKSLLYMRYLFEISFLINQEIHIARKLLEHNHFTTARLIVTKAKKLLPPENISSFTSAPISIINLNNLLKEIDILENENNIKILQRINFVIDNKNLSEAAELYCNNFFAFNPATQTKASLRFGKLLTTSKNDKIKLIPQMVVNYTHEQLINDKNLEIIIPTAINFSKISNLFWYDDGDERVLFFESLLDLNRNDKNICYAIRDKSNQKIYSCAYFSLNSDKKKAILISCMTKIKYHKGNFASLLLIAAMKDLESKGYGFFKLESSTSGVPLYIKLGFNLTKDVKFNNIDNIDKKINKIFDSRVEKKMEFKFQNEQQNNQFETRVAELKKRHKNNRLVDSSKAEFSPISEIQIQNSQNDFLIKENIQIFQDIDLLIENKKLHAAMDLYFIHFFSFNTATQRQANLKYKELLASQCKKQNFKAKLIPKILTQYPIEELLNYNNLEVVIPTAMNFSKIQKLFFKNDTPEKVRFYGVILEGGYDQYDICYAIREKDTHKIFSYVHFQLIEYKNEAILFSCTTNKKYLNTNVSTLLLITAMKHLESLNYNMFEFPLIDDLIPFLNKICINSYNEFLKINNFDFKNKQQNKQFEIQIYELQLPYKKNKLPNLLENKNEHEFINCFLEIQQLSNPEELASMWIKLATNGTVTIFKIIFSIPKYKEYFLNHLLLKPINNNFTYNAILSNQVEFFKYLLIESKISIPNAEELLQSFYFTAKSLNLLELAALFGCYCLNFSGNYWKSIILRSEQQSPSYAIHFALQHHQEKIALLLLNAGVSINTPDKNGNTPLMIVCEHGNEGLLKLFAEKYAANLFIENNDQEDILKIAEKYNSSLLSTIATFQLNRFLPDSELSDSSVNKISLLLKFKPNLDYIYPGNSINSRTYLVIKGFIALLPNIEMIESKSRSPSKPIRWRYEPSSHEREPKKLRTKYEGYPFNWKAYSERRQESNSAETKIVNAL